MNKHDKNRYFLAALRQRLKALGRGGQTIVCAGSGMSSGHLSDIVSGKKPTTEESRGKIAMAVESTEDDMIAEGVILEGEPAQTPLPLLAAQSLPFRRVHRPRDISEPEPWVAEALGQAWAVLESGTKTAEALLMNIQEFYEKVTPPQKGRARPGGRQTAGAADGGKRRRVASGE